MSLSPLLSSPLLSSHAAYFFDTYCYITYHHSICFTVDSTKLAFISSHLAAHEGAKKCGLRNDHVKEILGRWGIGILASFDNPFPLTHEEILPSNLTINTLSTSCPHSHLLETISFLDDPSSSSSLAPNPLSPLLSTPPIHLIGGVRAGDKRFDVTVQFHHVFFMGDMNYRLAMPSSGTSTSVDSSVHSAKRTKPSSLATVAIAPQGMKDEEEEEEEPVGKGITISPLIV